MRFDAADGQGFALEFAALGDAAELGAATPAGRLGGMAGYDQPCRVRGIVRAGGREQRVRRARPARACLGRRRLGADRARAHGDGVDRTPAAPRSPRSARPAPRDHAEEATWAALWEPGSRRAATRGSACEVEDGRLSTTYDADGHTRRAGLELWPTGRRVAAPRRRRGAVRLVARPRLAAARLRVLPLAPRGPRRRRPLRHPAPRRVIHAVVSDFGGVLTAPLMQGFARIQADTGVPPEAFGAALARATADGRPQPAVRARGRRDHRGRVPRDARARARGGARAAGRAARVRRALHGGARRRTTSCSPTTARCTSAACASRC